LLNKHKAIKMKKIILSLLLLTTLNLFAQENYWTSYNFNVDVEDEEIVAKLTNDYFSSPNSKAEGVTVFLFENHFKDISNNASHTIAFTGTLDAMGKQYSQGDDLSWDLFLSKLNRYTKSHSSAAGRSLISFGVPGNYPVQNLYILKVKNGRKFAAAWENYNTISNPEDRRVTFGQFNLGRSTNGETHYVLSEVNSFKDAFGMKKFRDRISSAKNTAWNKFIEEFDGNAEMVKTKTRTVVGKW
jgi:hypothetical protein